MNAGNGNKADKRKWVPHHKEERASS
jgi:hypothetical protein